MDSYRYRNMPLEYFDISVRAYNCLKRAGYKTVGEITNLTPSLLKQVRNLNSACFEDIVNQLQELGLSLRDGEFPVSVDMDDSYDPAIERDNNIRVDVEEAFWSFSGKLYVPFLQIRITNESEYNVHISKITVAFYNTTDLELWDIAVDDALSVDSLNPGSHTTRSFSASIGHEGKISEDSLPVITAKLFIDGKFYGNINIARTYTENSDAKILIYSRGSNYSLILYDEQRFRLVLKHNYWTLENGMYVPSLDIDVINQTLRTEEDVLIKAAFYDLNDKKLWCESSCSLTGSEAPLLPGYKKTAFIRGDKGFTTKIEESALPDLFADIFHYYSHSSYGQVRIRPSYECSIVNEIIKDDLSITSESSYVRKSDQPYYLLIVGSCWIKSQDRYVPNLKIELTNQRDKFIDSVSVKVTFINNSNGETWCEEGGWLSFDVPLRTGFTTTLTVRGTKGYNDKIDENSLPFLTAEVFLYNKSYGTTDIRRTYENHTIHEEL